MSDNSAGMKFNWSIRVYYEDTDAAGVVYHASYLKFMERARTEWLRSLGYSQESLKKEEQIVFAVANINIRFVKPALLDQELNVITTVTNVGGASIRFEQSIIDNESTQTICQADVDVVCIDSDALKPKRIPETVKAKFYHGE